MTPHTFKVYRCQCGRRTVSSDKVCIECHMRHHRARLRLGHKSERPKLLPIKENILKEEYN